MRWVEASKALRVSKHVGLSDFMGLTLMASDPENFGLGWPLAIRLDQLDHRLVNTQTQVKYFYATIKTCKLTHIFALDYN